MKIMTYNILEGGIDSSGSRIEYIVDIIKKEDPDFVAIQEASDFDINEYELLKRVSNETKLPYYALSQGTLASDQKIFHVASLSRYPLQEEYLFPGSTFQCALFPWSLIRFLENSQFVISICMHVQKMKELERLR